MHMTKTILNPCYHANGTIVDLDLEKVVLHTVNGERMTEEYFDTLEEEKEETMNATLMTAKREG